VDISINGELVLKSCQLLNVLTGEIYEIDIVIADGKIVGLTDKGKGQGSEIIDCSGLFAVPGFIDAHFHTESTLLDLPELAKVLLQRGTTAIFVNPHEIANVLGVEGVKLLLKDAANLPLHVYVLAPCKVPTVPGLETSGAAIDVAEIKEMLTWPEVVGIGEIDAFKLLKPNPKFTEMIELAKNKNLSVCGSINRFRGEALSRCIAAGITDDHESVLAEEALEKLRLGATVFVREGSSERNLAELLTGLKDKLDFFDNLCFCTDDKHPDELLAEGHIDYCVKKAISLGIKPSLAYRLASFNAAKHYNLQQKIGTIAPGRQADIVLLSDLENVTIEKVIFNGELVVEQKKILWSPSNLVNNRWGRGTIKVKQPIKADDVKVIMNREKDCCTVKAAKLIPNQIITEIIDVELAVKDKQVQIDLKQDIAKFILVERHNASGKIVKGFVKGFGLKKGALASSVAHDHHHLVALGVDDGDIALALNSLIKMEGGLVVILDGRILASLPLPIAGLLSDLELEEVLEKLLDLNKAAQELGITLESPFSVLSLLSLPVIPEAGFTDLGMIDVLQQKVIDVVV
jgi:adenine deaminase